MIEIKRYVPQLAPKDYSKIVVVNSRGTESKKDLMELEYVFNDEKFTIKDLINKLYAEIVELQEQNKLLKEELLETINKNVEEQKAINENFLEYIKDGGVI